MELMRIRRHFSLRACSLEAPLIEDDQNGLTDCLSSARACLFLTG